MPVRAFDPSREAETLRRFLIEEDPEDYLLEDFDAWAWTPGIIVATEGDRLVGLGRLTQLSPQEGWVSGFRVVRRRRGEGLGRALLRELLERARDAGPLVLRAIIEDKNRVSRRLFTSLGFRPVAALTLRHGIASAPEPGAAALVRISDATLLPPVEWVGVRHGVVDLLPDRDVGRFGPWRPELYARWAAEGKLYAGADLVVAVQLRWRKNPPTVWISPLVGAPQRLIPALGHLAGDLGGTAWDGYFPGDETVRPLYDRLGARALPEWGDRVALYERVP